jgi:hypothetical protein
MGTMVWGSKTDGGKTFSARRSKPTLRPTQSSLQLTLGLLREESSWELVLIIHLDGDLG